MIRTLLRHPVLLIEAVRAAAATAPPGWWRRFPFVPKPEPAYMRWRLQTAYGTSETQVTPRDLLAYLEWRRRTRRQG